MGQGTQESKYGQFLGHRYRGLLEKIPLAVVLLTAKPFIFALFAVWYQKKIGKI
jgi:hypothetical protein